MTARPRSVTRSWSALAGCALLAPLAGSTAAEEIFAISSVELDGRVVAADLADLDGDSRGDLLCLLVTGMPPDEQRTIHVFYQRPDITYPGAADWSAPLPGGVAAYDLAELDGQPGTELILLRRDRLTLLSLFERKAAFRDLPVGPEPTVAVAYDERGVDPLKIAREGLATEPRLVVPGLGWTAVLTPSGERLAQLDVGARANYFLPRRPGPSVSENEIELYFDHPRISVGDVDGDGRGDFVSATRHELRVFLQDERGRFTNDPTRRIALRLLSPEDHVRSSGAVRVDGIDFDADGRLDLLVSNSVGSLFAATTTVSIHLNQGNAWNLQRADQQFRIEGGLAGNAVLDLDGDGRVELIEARVPTGVLEVVEVLVTRALDVDVAIYRHGEGSLFDPRPWHRSKLGVGFSFETFRPLGFVPTLEVDLNGDGMKDLLGSGNGERLEVNLGKPEAGYGTRHAVQPLDTAGRVRFGDVDGDGLADFVLYDSRRPGKPVLVAINRGVLPGTVRKTEIR